MTLEVKLLQMMLYDCKCVLALAQILTHFKEVFSASG